MPDVTNGRLLELLKRSPERLSRMEDNHDVLRSDLQAIKGDTESFLRSEVAQDSAEPSESELWTDIYA